MYLPNRTRPIPPPTNRRLNEDRRDEELGPPIGWHDRRRSVERRLPSVEEGKIALHEWYIRLADFLACKKR